MKYNHVLNCSTFIFYNQGKRGKESRSSFVDGLVRAWWQRAGKPAHSTASSGRSHLAAAIKRCLIYFLVSVMSANISFVGFVINK